MKRRLALIGLFALLSSAAAPPAVTPAPPTQAAVPGNLLLNAGFEDWVAPTQIAAWARKLPGYIAAHWENDAPRPKFWMSDCSAYEKNAMLTGTLARDAAVRHGGNFSVRIHNPSATDITLVNYQPEAYGGPALTIKPERRYLLRWWVRGEQAQGSVLLMLYYKTRQENGQERRVYLHEQGALPRGDFAWQERSFCFTTTAHATTLSFSLQLRRGTGTIWYDDVELMELEPVVAVDVY